MSALSGIVPVRFLLPNGEKAVIKAKAHMTFSEVKQLIWAHYEKLWHKKIDDESMGSFAFRTKVGEVFFEETDSVSRMVHLANLFRDTEKRIRIYDMVLLRMQDVGDRHARATKTIKHNSGHKVISGWLFKKSKTWQRRWFILNDITLYWYESDKDCIAGKSASGVLPAGSFHVRTMPELTHKGQRVCFQFATEHLGKGKVTTLAAEDSKGMDNWISAVSRINLDRVKTIVVKCCEEILRRPWQKEEGIFRISGQKDKINTVKTRFDLSDYPDLTEIPNIHCVTGLLKIALREMQEPLLTFDLYPRFISVHGQPDTVHKQNIARIWNSVPPENKAILEYLFLFLHDIAQHAADHKMTYKNLAIVFAPNILRPATDTVDTMTHSNAVLTAVTLLIEHSPSLFPEAVQAKATAAAGPSAPPADMKVPAATAAAPPPPRRPIAPVQTEKLPAVPTMPVPPPPRASVVAADPQLLAQLQAQRQAAEAAAAQLEQQKAALAQQQAEFAKQQAEIARQKQEFEKQQAAFELEKQASVEANKAHEEAKAAAANAAAAAEEEQRLAAIEAERVAQLRDITDPTIQLKDHYDSKFNGSYVKLHALIQATPSLWEGVITEMATSEGLHHTQADAKYAALAKQLEATQNMWAQALDSYQNLHATLNDILQTYQEVNVPPPPQSAAPDVYEALYAFAGGQCEGDIVLTVGDQLECQAGSEAINGWLTGRNTRTGQTGYFPATYIKKL